MVIPIGGHTGSHGIVYAGKFFRHIPCLGLTTSWHFSMQGWGQTTSFLSAYSPSLTQPLLGAFFIIRFCFPKYLQIEKKIEWLYFFILEFWAF